jgi:hypothetical protein
MRLAGVTGSPEEPRLPPGYSLERSDPDVLVLRCPHGAAVARFSARGAAAKDIEREARTHYRERNRSA